MRLPRFLSPRGEHRRFRTARALAWIAILGCVHEASAATRVWENTGSDFATGGNWVGNTAPANNLTSDIASFQAATPVYHPNLSANRSINGLEFTSGTGSWTFTGSGGTRTLTLGSGGIVSNSSSTQTFNNSSLGIALGANTTFTSNSTGALFFGSSLASFSLGSYTLTLGGTSTNANNLIAENISGNGGITKTGTGTWTLSGTNTYSGATSLVQGTLQLNSSGAVGSTSGITVNTTGTGANNTALLIGASGVTVNRNITIANQGSGTTTLGGNITSGTGSFTGNITLNRSINLNADGTSTITFGNGNPAGGVISGSGGITKTGTGTVVMNDAHTYTGATTINAGTLTLAAAERLSNSTAVTVASGATFNLNNYNETVASLAGAGNVTLGSGTLATAGNASTAFSGVISGTGGLTKAGSGTLTLSGANTYTGATTINAGTLALGAANTLADSTAVTVASGATFNLNNFSETVGTLAGAGNVTLGSGTLATAGNTNTTFSGVLSGTGGLTKGGSGTLTLSGNNTYTGATTINAGTLALGGNNRLADSTAVTVASGASFNLSNYSDTVGSIDGAGTINFGSGSLTVAGNAFTTFSGVITGSGSLTKAGSGTLTLSGNNTYTGATVINGGILSVNSITNGSSASAIGASSNAAASLVLNGGTLQYTGSGHSSNRLFTLGTSGGSIDASGSGALNLTSTSGVVYTGTNTARTLTLTGTNTGANTLAALIGNNGSGATSLVKDGTGTWILSGNSTYTGVTTINGGILSVSTMANGGSASAIGASSNAATNLVLNGGTLRYTGSGHSSNRLFTLGPTGGSIDASGSGALNLTNTGSIALSGTNTARTLTLTGTNTGNNTLAAVLGNNGSGATSLVKDGTGLWILSGANTYTGATTINAGTLRLGAAERLSNSTDVTVASGATFSLNNFNETVGSIAGTGNITLGSGTLATAGNASTTFSGVISGSGGLTKGGAGTLTLSGTNTYTGTTTVSQGTLFAAANNALGAASGNVTVNAGATLALDGGVKITRSGLLTLNGAGTSASTGALHAAGPTGTTSQWAGSITINSASTITAADNLLIIGNGATSQFNSTTLTLNADVTFHTPDTPAVTPIYEPVPSYVLDPANIVINSRIAGTGNLYKTGDGTLSIVRGISSSNTFTGNTYVQGGTLIVEGPSKYAHLSSPNIFVGNLGSTNDDTVVLQAGQVTGAPPGNNMIGVYDAATNASTSNLTIYEDGLFNMNRSSNGFVNITLHGGHIDGVGLDPLLTISGDLLAKSSAQTALIENLNLGIGSNNLTLDAEAGTTASGVDLIISGRIQQGVGFTALASGTALEKTGEGKVVFSGANTYGGVTQVSNGILNIQHESALGQNSGSLGSTNHGTVVTGDGQLQIEGGLTITNETLTLSGNGHGGTGALRSIDGTNTLNSFVLLSGDARIESDGGSHLIIANPGGVNNSILDGLAANRALTVGGAGDTTVNGAIGNSIGAITKQGAGTLTLAGNNSYTGATTVSQGALKITHNNGLSGTGVTVADGAALQFAQNASNQDITAVGVTATIQGTGLSNGGAIQNLNGNNTYLGSITLANNARIAAEAGSSLTLSGGVNGAGYTLNTGGAGNTTYTGVISGTGTAVNKTDAGTVTFGGNNANTYTGATTIAHGTLALDKTAGVTAIASTAVTIGDGSGAAGSATLLLSQSNQINDNAALTFASDGRLNLNNQSETVGSITGDGSIVFGTGQLTIGGNNSNSTFSGTLAGDSAAILNKNGSGTLTFNSDVNATPGDFAGTLNLNAGTLAFNADNAFTGTINVFAGTTLKLTDVDLNIANLNFLGTGSITLDFSGTSTLSVTNLSLAAGVTVNIINWANAVDYFFAQNWIGATQDLTGTTPMNQIVFDGGSPPWTGNNTVWQSYDDQITPVPEPSTYGALLIGAVGAHLGYRRWRRQKAAPKA